ncbi:hypothetical protein FCV25MIE_00504 [Fagus crenata]
MARKRFRNVGTVNDVSRLQPIHAGKQLNNFSNIDVLQGEASLERGVPSFTVVTPFQHNIITGRMHSSYYARLRRRMILDKKKKARDSFDGASSSQDIVNRCKEDRVLSCTVEKEADNGEEKISKSWNRS